MKTSGIVRRIDELGRIVIPKEIRKSLRVHDGDSLEILSNGPEEIILKKYSIMKNISDLAQIFTDSINSILKNDILITDTSNIIAVSGKLRKMCLNEKISVDIEHIIKKRDNVFEVHPKTFRITSETSVIMSYVCTPILVDGDVLGTIIILSDTTPISDIHMKLANLTGKILSKYLEE